MRIISGYYKGRTIKTIKSDKTRPTSDKLRESIFNVIGPYFDSGQVLDLFAGSGAVGIEALSRGMDKAYFIDKNYECIKTIKNNLNSLKIDNAVTLKMDYLGALKKFANENIKFDLIFVDPPYKMDVYEDIILFILENKLIEEDGVIILECDKNRTLNINDEQFYNVRSANKGNTIVTYLWK